MVDPPATCPGTSPHVPGHCPPSAAGAERIARLVDALVAQGVGGVVVVDGATGHVVGRGTVRADSRADLRFDPGKFPGFAEPLLSPSTLAHYGNDPAPLVESPPPARNRKRCATCGGAYRRGSDKCPSCGAYMDGTTKPKGRGGSQRA